MTSSMDNLDLARLLNQGDQKAFEEFYKEHYRTLVYFANLLIKDPPTAEDIVTETFLKLWKLRANFDTPQNIKAFLYITTRNACFNYLQHLKVRQRSFKEFSYIAGEGIEEEQVQRHLIESELLGEIVREVERLPSRMKSIIKLYINGFSTEEIGRRLGLSNNTVRVQKARAVKQLRVVILKKGLLVAILCFLAKRLVLSGGYTLPVQFIVSPKPDYLLACLPPALYCPVFLVVREPPDCRATGLLPALPIPSGAPILPATERPEVVVYML